MPTNGHQARPETRQSSYMFYSTFGKITARDATTGRRPVWPWLAAIAVALLALYGILTIALILFNSYRAEFESTNLPFDKTLTFAWSNNRFQVGERAELTVAVTNPIGEEVPVQKLEVQVPQHFLDGFTVDEDRCDVERRPDASGVIRCSGLSLPAGHRTAFTIPLWASQPGNYSGELRLALDLAVPLLRHPWYVMVDSAGNHTLNLSRARTLDLRVVPKP